MDAPAAPAPIAPRPREEDDELRLREEEVEARLPTLFFAPPLLLEPADRELLAAVDFDDRFAVPRLAVARVPALRPRALDLDFGFDLLFDLLFDAVFRALLLEAPRALARAPPRRDVARERLLPPPFEEPRPLPPPVLLRVCAICTPFRLHLPPCPDHTIPLLSTRSEPARVRILARPDGLTIEIQPLVRVRAARVRLALVTVLVLAGALVAAARLGRAWDQGLRRGSFSELPLPLLIALSAAVGASAPAALLGLAALAFAEERIEIRPDTVTIQSTAFERTRTVRIPRSELAHWRETYLPLPPWWSWAVRRLAARAGGRLHSVGGAAGPREKRMIAQALARATGTPLIGVWGARVALLGESGGRESC